MERAAAPCWGHPDLGDWILHAEGCVLAWYGHLRDARKKSRQAADSVQHATHKREHAATYNGWMAVREALFGNSREAREYAAAALDIAKGRDVVYGAAFALALTGDTARSQMVSKDLEKKPEDTYVKYNYLPTLRALWAVNRGDASAAIESLAITPYELAVSGSGTGLFGKMSPVYARGQAYLLAHRASEAAAQFQRILDRPGADPVGVAARLQLARAFKMSGDTAKARAAYQDFLSLWKDADSDIPILRDAKAEYASLQ